MSRRKQRYPYHNADVDNGNESCNFLKPSETEKFLCDSQKTKPTKSNFSFRSPNHRNVFPRENKTLNSSINNEKISFKSDHFIEVKLPQQDPAKISPLSKKSNGNILYQCLNIKESLKNDRNMKFNSSITNCNNFNNISSSSSPHINTTSKCGNGENSIINIKSDKNKNISDKFNDPSNSIDFMPLTNAVPLNSKNLNSSVINSKLNTTTNIGRYIARIETNSESSTISTINNSFAPNSPPNHVENKEVICDIEIQKNNPDKCVDSARKMNQDDFSKSVVKEKQSAKDSGGGFACPICDEIFKTKRAFNLHILVHCQKEFRPENQSSNAICPTSKPLDLSCKNSNTDANSMKISPITNFYINKKVHINGGTEYAKDGLYINYNTTNGNPLETSLPSLIDIDSKNSPPPLSLPEDHDLLNPSNGADSADGELSSSVSPSSDRSPYEDETENRVNEAKEYEKAFCDASFNQEFLSEDSSDFDPPPLPLIQTAELSRKVKVASEEGPPMVYTVKFHAEQLFVSRILGTNEETGDKIELYKCLMCHLSFPSISRLQSHLSGHKQKFWCRKCSFSCDSRIVFSEHVQKEHVQFEIERSRQKSEESLNNAFANKSRKNTTHSLDAENTVTVAALLSALHGGKNMQTTLIPVLSNCIKREVDEDDEKEYNVGSDYHQSYQSFSSIHQDPNGVETSLNNTKEKDMYKMFSCRFCGKKFDRAFSCNRHERVHTGFKPCFCRICGRGFSEPRNLRHHVIRFHSDGSLRHLIKRDRRRKKDDLQDIVIHSDLSSNNNSLATETNTTSSILNELLLSSRSDMPRRNHSNSNSNSTGFSVNNRPQLGGYRFALKDTGSIPDVATISRYSPIIESANSPPETNSSDSIPFYDRKRKRSLSPVSCQTINKRPSSVASSSLEDRRSLSPSGDLEIDTSDDFENNSKSIYTNGESKETYFSIKNNETTSKIIEDSNVIENHQIMNSLNGDDDTEANLCNGPRNSSIRNQTKHTQHISAFQKVKKFTDKDDDRKELNSKNENFFDSAKSRNPDGLNSTKHALTNANVMSNSYKIERSNYPSLQNVPKFNDKDVKNLKHKADNHTMKYLDSSKSKIPDDSHKRAEPQLEPGEVRLSPNVRIVDDGDRGRRLVIDESAISSGGEENDHSPQFSSYAPRLNIVQSPIDRSKVLTPITDDKGRNFFECPYCLKLFGSASDLGRHLDFHEDLRPYECQYCDYSARTNSQLKVHKMRHEGIRQFNCDICNYNGVTQSDLNRHKKTQTHLSRSLHVCVYCGLGFYTTSQMQVHISTCHPDMEGASSLIQMSLGQPPPLIAMKTTTEDRDSATGCTLSDPTELCQ